jgi:hypothetical protein
VVVTSAEMRTDAAGVVGLEVRGFNPGTEAVSVTYCLAKAAGFSCAQQTNLEGTLLGIELPMVDGAVTVPFGPKKIVTVWMS